MDGGWIPFQGIDDFMFGATSMLKLTCTTADCDVYFIAGHNQHGRHWWRHNQHGDPVAGRPVTELPPDSFVLSDSNGGANIANPISGTPTGNPYSVWKMSLLIDDVLHIEHARFGEQWHGTVLIKKKPTSTKPKYIRVGSGCCHIAPTGDFASIYSQGLGTANYAGEDYGNMVGWTTLTGWRNFPRSTCEATCEESPDCEGYSVSPPENSCFLYKMCPSSALDGQMASSCTPNGFVSYKSPAHAEKLMGNGQDVRVVLEDDNRWEMGGKCVRCWKTITGKHVQHGF